MDVLHLELEVLGAAGLDDVAVIEHFLCVLAGFVSARAEGCHVITSDCPVAFVQHVVNLDGADFERVAARVVSLSEKRLQVLRYLLDSGWIHHVRHQVKELVLSQDTIKV